MFAHLFAVLLSAQPVSDDIDVFMAKVLEKREINWEDYRNYFCSERAELSIEGALAAVPIQGTTREFLWYVRDGYMVRSPVSVDGVAVSPEEREAAELAWIERLEKRESSGPDREGFLGFEFEPGRYFFAGRQEFEDREVYAIEYYPEDAFGDDEDDEDEREEDDAEDAEDAEDAKEQEFEAKFNKVLLVTMLIDPKEYQIVHMTLDNVGFDFLPGKWLVQVDTLEASMTMHQPFAPLDEVWLSRDIKALGRITTAAGDLGLRYETSFYNCARGRDEHELRVPQAASEAEAQVEVEEEKVTSLRRLVMAASLVPICGFGATSPDGRVALVRVHGNHTLPDEDVLRIAGVVEGDAFAAGDAEAIEARLLGSGKFASADVRVRYRSLSATGDVALVIVVREKRSVASRIMVAPIVNLSDEYGFTIGATTALVDAGVEGARIAFPLSWGGTRRAAFEAQWPLGRRTRHLYADLSRWRRDNPHFDVPENRFELEGGVRARRSRFGLELGAGVSDVDFSSRSERFLSLGAGLAFDTRRDPTIPGNAVYAGIDWRRLFFDANDRTDVHEVTLDLRGYKRLKGQATLAVQALYQTASAPLPDYERPFLGGGKTLRGFEAGRFIGDNAALGTVELRVPLTSPLSIVRAGVHGFYDIGAAYDHGRSIRKTRFHDAVGVGAFFRFAVFGVRLDVGFDMKGNSRWHIGSGFKF